MALDTGATQTTMDLNMLLMEGISLQDFVGQQAVETANGLVMADIYFLPELEFAGQTLLNVPVQVIEPSIFIWKPSTAMYGSHMKTLPLVCCSVNRKTRKSWNMP